MLLGGLVWDKVLVLLLLALFVLGPERLPVVAEEAGKTCANSGSGSQP